MSDLEGIQDVTIIIIRNGLSKPSSNPERGCLYFSLC